MPVLIHVSDPVAFFQPIDEHNEHYLTLQEFPGWSFLGSHFGKWDLLAQRNRMIARHPRTTFILPHVANLPEDLASVGELLDAHPNVVIDFSARIDELGRQPYTARDFFLRYQDRILFGLDMPVSRRGVSLLLPPPRNARRVLRLSRLHRPVRRLHALEALRARPSRRGASEDLPRERETRHPHALHDVTGYMQGPWCLATMSVDCLRLHVDSLANLRPVATGRKVSTIRRAEIPEPPEVTNAAAQDWRIPGGGGIMSLQGVYDEGIESTRIDPSVGRFSTVESVWR